MRGRPFAVILLAIALFAGAFAGLVAVVLPATVSTATVAETPTPKPTPTATAPAPSPTDCSVKVGDQVVYFANEPSPPKEGERSYGAPIIEPPVPAQPAQILTTSEVEVAAADIWWRLCRDRAFAASTIAWPQQMLDANAALTTSQWLSTLTYLRQHGVWTVSKEAPDQGAYLWYGNRPAGSWTTYMVPSPTGGKPTVGAAPYDHGPSWFLVVPFDGAGGSPGGVRIYFRLQCGGQPVGDFFALPYQFQHS